MDRQENKCRQLNANNVINMETATCETEFAVQRHKGATNFLCLNYTNYFLIITLQLEKGIKQDIYVLSLISLEHKNFFIFYFFSFLPPLPASLKSFFSLHPIFHLFFDWTGSLTADFDWLREHWRAESVLRRQGCGVSISDTCRDAQRCTPVSAFGNTNVHACRLTHIWANFSHPFTQTLRWYDIESKYLKWNHVSTLAPKVIM